MALLISSTRFYRLVTNAKPRIRTVKTGIVERFGGSNWETEIEGIPELANKVLTDVALVEPYPDGKPGYPIGDIMVGPTKRITLYVVEIRARSYQSVPCRCRELMRIEDYYALQNHLRHVQSLQRALTRYGG